MNILKTLGRVWCSLSFHALLILLPTVLALILLLGSPEHIKKTLKESGVYDKFVPALIEESKKSNTEPSSRQVLEDKEVLRIVEATFTPAFLQSLSEKTLDGTYAWLEGKTPEPVITVPISQPRDTLLTELSAYAEKYTSQLPVCNAAQLQQLQQDTQYILSLPCRPPDLTPQQAGKQFSENILGDNDILKKDAITVSDLPKNKNGEPLHKKVEWAPTAFQWTKRAPWIIGALTLLAAIGYVYLSKDRRHAVHTLSFTLIGTGVFLLIGSILYYFVFRKISLMSGLGGSSELQSAITNTVSSLTNDLNRMIAFTGGSYVAVGSAVLVWIHLIKKPAQTAETKAPVSNKN